MIQDRGDYDAAISEYEKSLKIKEDIHDRAGVAQSLHQIGIIHQQRGDYDTALSEYEKSLKIKEEIGDRAGVAASLHQIGNIQYLRGDYDAALSEYEKSLKIAEDMGDRAGIALSYGQMGKLLVQLEKYSDAFDLLLTALSIFVELQSPNAGIVVNFLKELREKWSAENFDAAWKEKTGEDVPEWLVV